MRLYFDRKIGNLFHYGHFIVDAVIPFLGLYPSLGEGEVVRVMDRTDQHMGSFTSFFQQLFPKIRLEYIPSVTFHDPHHHNDSLVNLAGHQFGPYPVPLLEWAETHLQWGHNDGVSVYQILVIERGFRRLELPRHCRANLNDTGNRRRRLDNQHEINEAVRAFGREHGLTVGVVALEHLPIAEQQRLFAGASIIIGQHGAGLCNLVFAARQRHGHVLEISYWGLQTIRDLTHAKGWHHHIVPSTMRHCQIVPLVEILKQVVI